MGNLGRGVAAVGLLMIAGICGQVVSAAPGEPVTDTMPLGNLPGNPTYDMPSGQRLISAFGERPVYSPDGRRIAFIGKSYGDAYEYEIATGRIRNLTAHMPHEGFLRVHYLRDGSFILEGPHLPHANRMDTRFKAIELFWMDAAASRPAVPLKRTVFEGVATAHDSNTIAWSELEPAGATFGTAKSTTLRTAEVSLVDGQATLTNVRDVVTTRQCLVEAQDFLPGDRELTVPCYHFGAKPPKPLVEVASIDLRSGAMKIYPTPPSLYNEVEGLFPDGRRTLVECSGDRAIGMDICVLELKEHKPAYTRLTRIMDYGRWKYGNPVVSPDGRHVAAQVGPAEVEAGVGQGIVIIDLPANF